MSVSTASRALAGNSRISSATRQRVIAAAERLGYVPDWFQSMVGHGHRGITAGTEAVVAVLHHRLAGDAATNQRIGQRIRARYEPALRRLGLHLALVVTGADRLDPAQERDLMARRLVGCIVRSASGFTLGDQWQRLPVVAIQTRPTGRVDAFITTDRSGLLLDALARVERAGLSHPCLLVHASTVERLGPDDDQLCATIDGLVSPRVPRRARLSVASLPTAGWPAFDPDSLPSDTDCLLSFVSGTWRHAVRRGNTSVRRLPGILLTTAYEPEAGCTWAQYVSDDPGLLACHVLDLLCRSRSRTGERPPLRLHSPFRFLPGHGFPD